MKSLSLFLLCLLFAFQGWSQTRYFTKKAQVSFYSEAEEENIEAHNKRGTTIFDAESGAMEFSVLIRAFEFEKALMQEHFNEEYMESHKYPKGTFKGTITNIKDINFQEDGSYEATIEGKLTLHGETNEISTTGVFTVKNGKISFESSFDVAVEDYKIKIPSTVTNNIAEIITIKVNVDDYQEYKK